MKEKVLWTINIALILVACFFTLHLLEINLPTLGKAQYWLDDDEPVCIAGFGKKKSLLDMNLCCSELQMQLRCENQKNTVLMGEKELAVDKRCFVGKGAVEYFVNMKAYNFCKKESNIQV